MNTNTKNNVIGEVSVEVKVKAGLSVDEKTFRTCMNLVSVYAENHGIKGMIVQFNTEWEDGYRFRIIEDGRDVTKAMHMPFKSEEIN